MGDVVAEPTEGMTQVDCTFARCVQFWCSVAARPQNALLSLSLAMVQATVITAVISHVKCQPVLRDALSDATASPLERRMVEQVAIMGVVHVSRRHQRRR